MEALSRIPTTGLGAPVSVLKKAKNHRPVTVRQSFTKTNRPEDSRAPIRFSRCPGWAVMAWLSPLRGPDRAVRWLGRKAGLVHLGQFDATGLSFGDQLALGLDESLRVAFF